VTDINFNTAEPNGNVDDTTLDGSLNDLTGNEIKAPVSKAVLEYIVKELVTQPQDVVVDEVDDRFLQLRLMVAPQDIGRVIGRQGRVASALRLLLKAAGVRDGVQTRLEIVE
jgi:predicted RNA-binding protein YlqC (UPF0109 family)